MSGNGARASAPIPESDERRAAQSRAIAAATGLDDAMLERLVRAFYDAARRDAVLGPVFAGVTDWEAHVATITAFWSSVALQSGRYHGQPMAAHMPLGLDPAHFRQWLALFERIAREVCPPAGAAHLIERAHRIAQSLELGIAARRGELPPRS